MSDFIYFVAFVSISFLAGLAVAFEIIGRTINEEILFLNIRNAVLTYCAGIVIAICFMVVSVLCIIKFQAIL